MPLQHGLAVVAVFGACAWAQPPTPPAGMQWKKYELLSDEFDSYDPSKWVKGNPNWVGRPPSVFNNKTLSWVDGVFRITAMLNNTDYEGNWLFTGSLRSNTPAFKTGMYTEARVKSADLSLPSSFWLMSPPHVKNSNEIDVIENWGEVKKPGKNGFYETFPYSMMSNTHYHLDNGTDVHTPRRAANLDNAKNSDVFATFGVWKQDTRTVHFYRNGDWMSTADLAHDFDDDLYMLFDMELMSWGPGMPTVADIKNTSRCSAQYDYVHTYTLVPTRGEE